jgi:hypothetical protein
MMGCDIVLEELELQSETSDGCSSLLPARFQSITSQKPVIFIFTAMRALNITKEYLLTPDF